MLTTWEVICIPSVLVMYLNETCSASEPKAVSAVGNFSRIGVPVQDLVLPALVH